MTDELNLRGRRVTLFLRERGLRFSGFVVQESENFITIQDDISGMTRIFNKLSIANLEVR